MSHWPQKIEIEQGELLLYITTLVRRFPPKFWRQNSLAADAIAACPLSCGSSCWGLPCAYYITTKRHTFYRQLGRGAAKGTLWAGRIITMMVFIVWKTWKMMLKSRQFVLGNLLTISHFLSFDGDQFDKNQSLKSQLCMRPCNASEFKFVINCSSFGQIWKAKFWAVVKCKLLRLLNKKVCSDLGHCM